MRSLPLYGRKKKMSKELIWLYVRIGLTSSFSVRRTMRCLPTGHLFRSQRNAPRLRGPYLSIPSCGQEYQYESDIASKMMFKEDPAKALGLPAIPVRGRAQLVEDAAPSPWPERYCSATVHSRLGPLCLRGERHSDHRSAAEHHVDPDDQAQRPGDGPR